MTHVVRVRVTPLADRRKKSVGLEDSTLERFYSNEVAASAAVCLALETVSRRVGRGEIEAGNGFTVKVEFTE